MNNGYATLVGNDFLQIRCAATKVFSVKEQYAFSFFMHMKITSKPFQGKRRMANYTNFNGNVID